MAELQAPIGFDRSRNVPLNIECYSSVKLWQLGRHGYCYGSKSGNIFHQRIPQPYGEPFSKGDVIGCYIHLPEWDKPYVTSRPDVFASSSLGDVALIFVC